MRRAAPLPPELLRGPFTTSDARHAGVGNRRLQADDIDRPFHGVAISAEGRGDIVERCRSYARLLRPGQVFSHATALALWGAPVPAAALRTLHVSVVFPRTPPRGGGTVGHSLQRLHAVLHRGLPVTDAASAWREAASVLSTDVLIAAGDALVTGSRRNGLRAPGLVTPEQLVAASDARFRAAGARRAREALDAIRVGVDSPAETSLRLLLRRSGLPEPAVDHLIPTSVSVFHADLAYPAARIAIEYEGDEHRTDRRRWMRDIRRRELMEDAGWRVVRVVAEDLRDPGPLILRLRHLLASR